MTCRILKGDCREVMPTLEPESVDLVLTDPPYGETSLAWDRWQTGWPAQARRVLKRTGSMWVFGSQRMFWDNRSDFPGWKFAQDVIWEKHNGSGFHADRFKRVHEIVVQFYRDDAPWAGVYKAPQFTNDAAARRVTRRKAPTHTGNIGDGEFLSVTNGPRLMRSVLYVRSEHGRAEHPTQKPIGIVEPLLLYSCPPGGTVLDCFSGSGTTGIVAAPKPEFVALTERRTSSDGFQFSQVPA